MSAELENEKAKRETAERAAREAMATAASEHAARQDAERSTREALATAAAERAARQAAEKIALEASARAAEEKRGREAAEKLAQESAAKVAIEKREREAAEALALETIAKGTAGHAPAATASVPSKAVQTTIPPTAPTSEPPRSDITSNWVVPLIIFAAAAMLFFLVSGFWTTWESSIAVRTDDAYIRADIAPLSTKVAGVVRQTAVNDFDKVKAGQILVELKNDEYKARVE